MKIAFVNYVLEPTKPGLSGLSDMVWDMASALVDQGHEIHVVASYHTQTYPDNRVKVHNFPTPPIGYRNIVGQLWILARAAKILRRLNADVVHAPEYVSTAVIRTLGVTTPTVLTVPGNIFYRLSRNDGSKNEWAYTQVLKWAARTSARRCSKVIAISTDMKRWWEWTGSLPENTPMIPLGVSPERFQPVQAARQKLGLEEGPVTIIYVGRFAMEKGLLYVLDALNLLKQSMPEHFENLRLHLIGKGDLEAQLQQKRLSLGLETAVQIHPWAAPGEVNTWYSAADALILPSSAEGFSRTIPEAMSCGTPVIGSAISGTEDHVQDDINGFLFPWGDTQALAVVLASLLKDPDRLRAMRSATREYAQQHLQWPGIMERVVEEVYKPISTYKPKM